MKTYFLFGSGIIGAFHDGGMRAACKYAQKETDWSVFCFQDGMRPGDLLYAYDGYGDWVVIGEKEYKKLSNI